MLIDYSNGENTPFYYLTVDIRSHSIKLYNFNDLIKNLLISFCYRLALYGPTKRGNKFIMAPKKIYVGVTKDRNKFYFHISLLDEVIDYLTNKGVYKKNIQFIKKDYYQPLNINLFYHDKRIPRDYQEEAINYILNEGKIKLITLKPGEGKTFITLNSISKINQRVCFIIKPMYIEKWIKDINESFNIKKPDIVVIKGSKNLKELTHAAFDEDFKAPFILISNKTYYNYINDFEMYQEQMLHLGYKFIPEDFNEYLKIGLRIVDESHQDSHFNFRLDCYTHIPKTLALTGTLDSSNEFINKMHYIQYPLYERLKNENKKPHSKAEALIYAIDDVNARIKFVNPQLKMYSHVRFEQSILNKKSILNSYLKMIFDIVNNRFIKSYKKGQKSLIFFSTVELCDVAQKYIQNNINLNCIKYTAENEYDSIFTGDIIISTLKSLGTAIDIPNLVWILMTDAVDSKQVNLQALGRLRALSNYDEIDPLFSYLVCQNIYTHKKYHKNKMQIFKNDVIKHTEEYLKITI